MTHKPNYQILDTNYSDYAKGFEVQSPQKEFIEWDTTYDSLEKKASEYFIESAESRTNRQFRYPVRIGNILLYEFSAGAPLERSDVPILSYWSGCRDKTNTDKSYYEIRNKLKKDFPAESQNLLYERDDQNAFMFDADGIHISLGYTYKGVFQEEIHETSVSIQNAREYLPLAVDAEYEKVMEVSEYLVISEEITTCRFYMQVRRVKKRPVMLSQGQNSAPLIWIDNKNRKIGFADREFCQIFNKNEIESISIQNILPAKGGGGCKLELGIKGEEGTYTVYSGSCHGLDAYQDRISKLTGIEVVMQPEYYNC